MDRRDFLQQSSAVLAAGAPVAGGVGCATTGAAHRNADGRRVERFLADLESRRRSALQRRSSSTVRRQLRRSGLSSETLDQVQQKLRTDPDLLGQGLTHRIQAGARDASIAPEDEDRLHQIVGNLGWRLKRQDPGLLVGEVVDKLDRVAAVHGPVRTEYTEEGADEPTAAGGEPEHLAPKDEKSRSRKLAELGGKTCGIGGGALGLGILLIAVDVATALGIVLTLGGIVTILVGLVILLVSMIAFGAESASD